MNSLHNNRRFEYIWLKNKHPSHCHYLFKSVLFEYCSHVLEEKKKEVMSLLIE